MNELILAIIIFPLWIYLIWNISKIVDKNENKLN